MLQGTLTLNKHDDDDDDNQAGASVNWNTDLT